jgi:hypothetical protein
MKSTNVDLPASTVSDSASTVVSSTPLEGGAQAAKKARTKKIIGSRCQVYRGNATHTKGRLTKDDLFRNQHGRIVSKKRHEQGKIAIKYLEEGGYKGVLPSKRIKKTDVKTGKGVLEEASKVEGSVVLDK